MLTEDCATDNPVAGACADCGAMVSQRIACVDRMTHSIVELCERCWNASQQRQVFADGCCG